MENFGKMSYVCIMTEKEYRDKWKEDNPVYIKLYRMMYRRVYKFRKNGGGDIGMMITDMLGCSIMELSIHLEGKWVEGMSWGNYGKEWDVDHIIPLMSDKTLEGFIRLNHYTNLQPLWKKDNSDKAVNEIKLWK